MSVDSKQTVAVSFACSADSLDLLLDDLDVDTEGELSWLVWWHKSDDGFCIFRGPLSIRKTVKDFVGLEDGDSFEVVPVKTALDDLEAGKARDLSSDDEPKLTTKKALSLVNSWRTKVPVAAKSNESGGDLLRRKIAAYAKMEDWERTEVDG